MFFFNILGRKRYQQLLDEPKRLRQQHKQLEANTKILEKEKEDLKEEYRRERENREAQLEELRHQAKDYESLQARLQKLKEDVEVQIAEGIEAGVTELGFNPSQIETLWADRTDLIELYFERLYSLAKQFAMSNKEMRKSRGLFLLLVDQRNMISENFSEFHQGQTEYLTQGKYKGIDRLPHVFSSSIDEVLSYMGEKVAIKDESGETTGYEERDGALLINLKGFAFRSCIMVEGVRTHRVYEKVESLLKGSAKHNAGIYASSLDEVLAAIVVSEENSEVVVFRDGRFVKNYNPFTDTETLREQQLTQVEPEMEVTAAEVKALPEVTVVENVEVETDIEVEDDDVPAYIENVEVETDDASTPPPPPG